MKKQSPTNRDTSPRAGLSRRNFLKASGAAAGTILTLGPNMIDAAENSVPETGGAAPETNKGPFNILFILTDQERYFNPAELPTGYNLPGRDRLRREGVTFTNHQIGSAVCSSSRSVIYTGQHVQQTGVFDNLGFPWSRPLPADMPTVGTMFQSLGYHPAYLGKWHLSEEMEDIEIRHVPEADLAKLNKKMREHGFLDYFGVGDIIGMTLGGYRTDEFTTSTAVRWLRAETPQLREKNKPWFLALNLVNPHDVMFFDTDGPGEDAQKATHPAFSVNRAPEHELYQRRWDVQLPESRKELWEQPGRPQAHQEYQNARRALVGQFPNEDTRWQRLLSYYLSCIADCDRHIVRILDELDALGLADNTIVVVTSDHGELGGAHQMHGKGATAYREQNNVPLWIRHPMHRRVAGQECRAVTSHLDLAPTFLAFSGADAARRKTVAPQLKGKDLSGLVAAPETAGVDAARDGALYNYGMWLYADAAFVQKSVDASRAQKDVKKLGLKPDLNKRSAIRSVTDGHYRFTRYFSLKQHNTPRTLEKLFADNDVELFHVESDPHEMNNLAVDRKANGDALLAMNNKLTRLIEDEVGEDIGQELPETESGWAMTTIDP